MVAGFEKLPKGRLLAQFVDFDHEYGAAYERCIGYDKDYHVHDRPNLTFPRGSSVIAFTTKTPKETFKVDETSLLYMPAFVEHRQDSLSTIYDNLALFPLERALARRKLPSKTVKTTRSLLVNELLNRFFVDRILKRRPASSLVELTTQIVDETIRLLTASDEPELRMPFLGTSADRAIQYIEANLFHDISTRDLVFHARSSGATLFRQFRRATKMTPFEYIRRRRLDEAHHLLKTGDYNVGDVGLLVGYEDLPSFSKAFKKQFHIPPSKLKTPPS